MTNEERIRTISAILTAAHHEGTDVAELVSLAITKAATTVGSTDELLVHRSGSWEAMHVRQLSLAEHDLW